MIHLYKRRYFSLFFIFMSACLIFLAPTISKIKFSFSVVQQSQNNFQIITNFTASLQNDRLDLYRHLTDGVSGNSFLIKTSECRIPHYDHFDISVRPFLKRTPKVTKVCKKKYEDVTTARRGVLMFHPEKLPAKFHHQFANNSAFSTLNTNETSNSSKASKPSIICCYKGILRVNQNMTSYNANCDKKWKYTNCIPIERSETEIKTYESIVVFCKSDDKNIYVNVHHFIQKNKMENNSYVVAKIETLKSNRSPESRTKQLNVIIFGIDSVSRLHFLRRLPKTYDYLIQTLGALEFVGYNKVADNTYPNLLPVLSGLSEGELRNHSCLMKERKIFDDCPLIWKDFSRKGYVTAFMEDSPWLGLFNYLKLGFVNPPTDYYNRPFFLASESLIGKDSKKGNAKCQGKQLSYEVVQKYSFEFFEAFRDRPTFGFFWGTSLTHDTLSLAGLADEPTLKYLRDLNSINAFNDSVLLFMSDHGFRMGNFRKTYLGMMEERLPFVFLVFPEWFRKRYSSAYSNLSKNTKRLAANYDLYETLLDILHLKYANESYVKSAIRNDARGISLFQEIPWNRTCEAAGIPGHFCTCHEMKLIRNDETSVIKTAEFIAQSINWELRVYKMCLSTEKITILQSHAVIRRRGNTNSTNAENDATLMLQVQLDPGEVLVEATVKVHREKQIWSFELLGAISRINTYGNQSYCISDAVLRKYCVCKGVL